MFFFSIRVLGHSRYPLGGIISLHETQERLCGLEKVPRASVDLFIGNEQPSVMFSVKVLEESKCLMRSILLSVLDEVNEKECQMLKQLWCSTKGLEALFSYMHNKPYEK